jgi:hypothetical protein
MSIENNIFIKSLHPIIEEQGFFIMILIIINFQNYIKIYEIEFSLKI